MAAALLKGVAAVSRYSTVILCAHNENPVLMHSAEINRITSAISGSLPSALPGAPTPSRAADPSATKLRRE
ncbi:hypothetical protein ATCCBAA256_15790 [Mycobacterium montefiorense]|nr:hypothetical protein ATCCBAA256_15790 [Mycobacterium montefiorense]